MIESDMDIVEWVKTRRLAKGLSIRQMSKLSDIPHTTIADIEKGMKPSVNVVKKLADFFNVEQSYLFVLSRIMEGTKEIKGRFIDSIIYESNELSLSDQEEVLEYVRLRKKRAEEKKKSKK